jgi:hypothetical protein
MPPQIKTDLNRSGWETTDFPSVCEKCLPDNPYVQMLKEDHGAVSRFPPNIIFMSIILIVVGMQDMHTTIHHISLESRSHSATEADKYMPNMRAPQELLPVLHVGSVLWIATRRP